MDSENRKQLFTIRTDKDIKKQVGTGSLVIKLDVETRMEEGWQEEVLFGTGNYIDRKDKILEFNLFTASKTWPAAEAHCQSEGGHLPSVMSREEQRKVAVVAAGNKVWLGGSDKDEEGVWRWTDGSPWNYTNWEPNNGQSGDTYNCVLLSRPFGSGIKWYDYYCTDTYPFICQNIAHLRIGKSNMTFKLAKNQINFTSFSLFYHYKSNQQLLDSWTDKGRQL